MSEKRCVRLWDLTATAETICSSGSSLLLPSGYVQSGKRDYGECVHLGLDLSCSATGDSFAVDACPGQAILDAITLQYLKGNKKKLNHMMARDFYSTILPKTKGQKSHQDMQQTHHF